MSLPLVLLVDDSEAQLAFERAALSGHYAIVTASDGVAALEELRRNELAAVLLDLSMPRMDGDEVLRVLQREKQRVPVIVVTSETHRKDEVLRLGARAFVEKPVRAQALLPLVARIIDEARRERAADNLKVLFVTAGKRELGLLLEPIREVLPQIAMQAGRIVVRGETLPVVELPALFDEEHALPLVDRKLVVVQGGIAICVDEVREPEELSSALVDKESPRPPRAIALARTGRGLLPIVDPRELSP